MIDPTTPAFPTNVAQVLGAQIKLLDDEIYTFSRPLKHTDPNVSVSTFGLQWEPDERTWETRGQGAMGPTVQRYLVVIQAFVKDMDVERGAAKHSVLSAMIRGMLHRSPTLRVALTSLVVTTEDYTESLRRWSIRSQRFLNNELGGSWLYLATTEVLIETEML